MKLLNKVILFLILTLFGISYYCTEQRGCINFIASSTFTRYSLIIEQFTPFISKAIGVLVIIIFSRIVIYFLQTALKQYAAFFGRNGQQKLGINVIRYAVWFVALLIILSILFENVAVLFTSLGLVGFGITFALQKPILNFVGWLTILTNRTFSVGDRIRVGSVRGDVIDVKLMYTTLDGLLENTDELSGKIITLPNEMVLTTPIINFTRSSNYVWDELEVTITYESNWEKGVRLLEEAAIKAVNKHLKPNTIIPNEKRTRRNARVGLFKILGRRNEKLSIFQKRQKTKREKDHFMITEHMENKPIVRVMFKDSSIALNVRYLAYYKSLMTIKSEINSFFLINIARTKDVEIAYPHIQLVTKGKTRIRKLIK